MGTIDAWSSDYVSEHNFAESIKGNAAVPLYYVKRVQEIELQDDFLDYGFRGKGKVICVDK